MIIDVTFKTPDTITDALKREIQDVYGQTLEEIESDYYNCNADHPNFEQKKSRMEAVQAEVAKMKALFDTVIHYGELISIRFNTDNSTVTVNP